MKPKLDKKKFKILILYLGYNDMVKKTSHATVPLKRTEQIQQVLYTVHLFDSLEKRVRNKTRYSSFLVEWKSKKPIWQLH